jgi:hypothetical protein
MPRKKKEEQPAAEPVKEIEPTKAELCSKYTTPDELRAKVEEFLDKYRDTPGILLPNMLLYLGISRAQAEALRKQGDEWVEIFEFAKLHREAYLLANMVTDNKKAQGCLNALKQPENGGYVDRFQNHEQGKVTVDVANVGGIAAAK